MNNWKNIWNNQDRVNKYILEMLIKVDGFDSGPGKLDVDEWLEYSSNFYNILGIENNDTIFEVGCGAGAFLFPLALKNYKVGGIDYSIPLINLAKKIIVHGNFEVKEAVYLDTTKKYDIVISNGTFNYFPNLEYSKTVIKKMIKKSRKKIGIFDINDISKKNEYHKIRMKKMGKEYLRKYKGLDHLFYDKNFFYNIAKRYNLKIKIFNHTFKNYGNAELRFNVIMEIQ